MSTEDLREILEKREKLICRNCMDCERLNNCRIWENIAIWVMIRFETVTQLKAARSNALAIIMSKSTVEEKTCAKNLLAGFEMNKKGMEQILPEKKKRIPAHFNLQRRRFSALWNK